MQQGPLRVALVSPLFESVPPKLYGGTGRIVSYLTEELVRQGHFVTLFASGDSVTKARLRAGAKIALRLDDCRDPWAAHALMLDEVLESAWQFDVIHFHTEHWHLPFARRMKLPALTTLHGRLDLPELVPLYRRFNDAPLVSVSDGQRGPLGFCNWIGTVQHGIPAGLLSLRRGPGTYLAFLGDMSPETGPDRAVRIARRAGIPLRMAAKIGKGAGEEYFRREVRPLLGAGIEFAGEVGERDRNEFLGGALAMLCPVEGPAPSGLAMIESMACGTPVIAYRRGAAPEVVQQAVTGCLVDDEDEAVRAARRIHELDRAGCRKAFEERFTVERMARDYTHLYRGIHQVHDLAQRVAAARAARLATAVQADVPAMRPRDDLLASRR